MDYKIITDELVKQLNIKCDEALKDQEKIKQLQEAVGDKDREIKELKAWKESAMLVMSPVQEIGKAIGLKLGESILDKVVPAIEAKDKQVEYYKALAEGYKKLLKIADCPSILLENPWILFASTPTEKDLNWAEDVVKRYEQSEQRIIEGL